MPEFINPTNVSILISLIMSVIAVLRTIAPVTKTTVDDDLVAFVDKSKATVRKLSLPIWAVIEEMEKAGKISKKAKYGEYLTMFRDFFRRTFGKEMPKEAEAEASILAAGYSASDKLQKKTLQNKDTEQ